MNECYASYALEKNIIDFVQTLPLQGQESFWNRCAHGACADSMYSQDWIDDKLGILPDEVYEKEYNMYSPRQVKSYKERFPTCEHPVNTVFNDNSKASHCPFGASGSYNQEAGYNVSIECFGYDKYKSRENPSKEMEYDTYEKYESYIKGKANASLFE